MGESSLGVRESTKALQVVAARAFYPGEGIHGFNEAGGVEGPDLRINVRGCGPECSARGTYHDDPRPRVAGVVSAARRGEGTRAARGGAEDKLAFQVGASWHKVKSITRDATRITSPSTYTVLFGDSKYEGYKT